MGQINFLTLFFGYGVYALFSSTFYYTVNVHMFFLKCSLL